MRRCCFFFIAFLLAILLFLATAGYEPQGPEQHPPQLVSENLERDPDTGGIALEPPTPSESLETTKNKRGTTQNTAP
jgi:hypothetical protein